MLNCVRPSSSSVVRRPSPVVVVRRPFRRRRRPLSCPPSVRRPSRRRRRPLSVRPVRPSSSSDVIVLDLERGRINVPKTVNTVVPFLRS